MKIVLLSLLLFSLLPINLLIGISQALTTPLQATNGLDLYQLNPLIQGTPNTTYTIKFVRLANPSQQPLTLHIQFYTPTPYLQLNYTSQLSLKPLGSKVLTASLTLLDLIPSGHYGLQYEIQSSPETSYSGTIPVIVFREQDPAVVQLTLCGKNPFQDIIYTQLHLSYNYQSKWYQLTPIYNFTHNLFLLKGNYQAILKDPFTGVSLTVPLSLTHNTSKTIVLPLLDIRITYFDQHILNLTITNYLGYQQGIIQYYNAKQELLQQYILIIENGQTLQSYPSFAIPNLTIQIHVKNYTLSYSLPISPNESLSLKTILFGIGLIGPSLLILTGVLILRLKTPNRRG